jgi:hypothetical protein
MASLFNVSLRPPESTDQEISEALLGPARHSPFPINQTIRDRWMRLMDNALGEAFAAKPSRSSPSEILQLTLPGYQIARWHLRASEVGNH